MNLWKKVNSMAGKSKVESVNFDQLASEMEVTLKLLDQCKNGEVVSKNKSVQMLAQLRKHFSSLQVKLKGARKHSLEIQELLVPKKELLEEPVLTEVDTSVPNAE